MQSLYGNISGYIGFFLGYSLFQIPKFLRSLLRFVRKIFLRITNKRSNTVNLESTATPNAGKVNVKGRNVEDELKHFNKELYELSGKFQELHDFMRK